MSLIIIKAIVHIYEPSCRTFTDRSLRRTLVQKEVIASGHAVQTAFNS